MTRIVKMANNLNFLIRQKLISSFHLDSLTEAILKMTGIHLSKLIQNGKMVYFQIQN